MFGKFFIKPQNSTSGNYEEILPSLYLLIRNVMDENERNIDLSPGTVLEEIGFDSIKYIHLFLSLEDIIDAELETIIAKIDLGSIRTIKDIAIMISVFSKK